MLIETGLSPSALALAALPFGLIIGSFLNVVILRFPEQQKQLAPGSEDFLGLPSEPVERSPW